MPPLSTATWIVNGSGTFTVGSNWDSGTVPSTGTNAAIPGNSITPYTVTLTGTATPESLIAAFSTLAINGGKLVLAQASTLDALTMTGGASWLEFVNGGSAVAAQSTITGPVVANGGSILVDSGSVLLEANSTLANNLFGPGTLILANSSTLDGFQIRDGATLVNQGAGTIFGGAAPAMYVGTQGNSAGILINAAGGTIALAGNFARINSASIGTLGTIFNAGLIEHKAGTVSNIISPIVINTGTIKADIGELDLYSGGTYAGTITGAGAVDFRGVHQTLASGLVIDVATINLLTDGIQPPILTLAGDQVYGGHLNLNGGGIALNGHTFELTSSATANLAGSSVDGPGTLIIDGAQTLATSSAQFILSNGATLDNRGTVTVAGPLTLMISPFPGPAPVFRNEAGAQFLISGGYLVNGYTGTSFFNDGLIESQSGNNFFLIPILNTGTIQVDQDVVTFSQGGTFGGTIDGGGSVVFNNANQTWGPGLSLLVPFVKINSGGTVTLGGDLGYGGTISAGSATIALNGHTLTLNSTAHSVLTNTVLLGDGEMVTYGSQAVDRLTVLKATLDNRGTESITSLDLILGDLSNAATLINEGTAFFAIGGDVNVGTFNGNAAARVVNQGTLEKTGGTGTSIIYPVFANTGTVRVDSGTLQFEGSNTYTGTFTGPGEVYFHNQSQTLAPGLVLSAGTVQLFGTTTLTGDQSYNGTLVSVGGPVIALNGHTLSLGASSSSQLITTNVTGPGVFAMNSSHGVGFLTISSGATLDGTGYLSEFGNYYLTIGGGTNDKATFLIENGGTFAITGDGGIYNGTANNAAGTVTNHGLFEKTGGFSSTIYPAFTSDGTIEVDTGVLLLPGAQSLSGLITGHGTVSTGTNTRLDNLTVNSGNTLFVPGNATIATGPLTLGNGAAGGAALDIGVNGRFNIMGDTSIVAGGATDTIVNFGLFQKVAGLGLSVVQPLFTNAKNAVGYVNSGTLVLANTVINDGGLTATAGGTLELGGAVYNDGSVNSAQLVVNGNGLIRFDGSVSAGQQIIFNDKQGEIALSDPIEFSGTLWNFQGNASQSDVIDIVGQTGLSLSYGANDILTVTNGQSVVVASLHFFQPQGTSFQKTEVNGDTLITLCFRRGTLIATPDGEVPVEDLQPAQAVLTAFGEVTPVRWIGRRRIDCTRHPQPAAAWPVLIRANAFGPGLPRRDLYVSPRHAIYAEGVLIPAQILINGRNVVQAELDTVDYFHVELDRHDVLLAEGLPAESYLETGDRSIFENGGGVVSLHPDLSRWVWDARACADLVVVGPELERVKATLLHNAGRRRLPKAASARRRMAS